MSENESYSLDNGAVPEIRRDLEIIPVQHGGEELLYFHDSMGYMQSNFALDASVEPLLNLINGELAIEQMVKLLQNQLTYEELHTFLTLLDDSLALNSKQFKLSKSEIESQFEESGQRKPTMAGLSYSDDPLEFEKDIKSILSSSNLHPVTKAKALYAPHIDMRVGASVYAEAFSLLKNLSPKKVVILATAHYAGFHADIYDGKPFIGSLKKFNIPGRVFISDKEAQNFLQLHGKQNGFTLNDRAHRIEHSIEMHLLFLSQIWQHEFQIVPILVSGFDDLFYVPDGDLAGKIHSFTSRLKEMIDEDTFVLISGDLSHVGKKFGDRKSAAQLKESVEKIDKLFLNLSARGDSDGLLSLLSENYDHTRICGFPPLYTYLKMFPGSKGEMINYHWWDEKERESAVSFGSVLF